MFLLAGVIVIGIAAGLLRGGSLRRLGDARLRATAAVFAAVALQVVAVFAPSGAPSVALSLASQAAAIGFAAANLRRTGLAILGVGAALNFTVVAANAGMPVDRTALVRAGVDDPFAGGRAHRGIHEPLDERSRLTFLADRVPVPTIGNVVSAGDLVLHAGLLLAVQGLMLPGRGRHGPADRPPAAGAGEPGSKKDSGSANPSASETR